MQRRNYLQSTGAGLASVLLANNAAANPGNGPPQGVPPEDPPVDAPPQKGESVIGYSDDPIKPVRVGIIGLGNRGTAMTQTIETLTPEMAEIRAVCDLRPERVEVNLEQFDEGTDPAVYTGSKTAWKKLARRDDLDLVFVFTNWGNHVPMCVYAMEQGHHAVTEVPAAVTLEGCWDLVDTAEKTQRHCMMLENVCYFEEEMWVLNMVKNGVFGDELNYGEGAYIHNLADNLFNRQPLPMWNHYRLRQHVKRQGNLYPTHGQGPIAQYMDILRGDKYEYLVSVESKETRLTERAKEADPDHEFYEHEDFAHGDMNMSLIQTHEGRTINLQHDVVTNRGYDRLNKIQGIDAYHEGYPSQLAVDSEGHGFVDEETYDDYWEEYRHPLWEEMGELADEVGGHGGSDFLELYRLFDALNVGRPLDMDVYDAATWSAVGPISRASVEKGSKPVAFPDFTRGRWDEDREWGTMKYPP